MAFHLGFKEVGNEVYKSRKVEKHPPVFGRATGALGWLGHGVRGRGRRKWDQESLLGRGWRASEGQY